MKNNDIINFIQEIEIYQSNHYDSYNRNNLVDAYRKLSGEFKIQISPKSIKGLYRGADGISEKPAISFTNARHLANLYGHYIIPFSYLEDYEGLIDSERLYKMVGSRAFKLITKDEFNVGNDEGEVIVIMPVWKKDINLEQMKESMQKKQTQITESVFSDRFQQFLEKGWQRPVEKNFIALVGKNKQKIVEEGEQGKQYLKELLDENQAILEDSCTDEFLEELNRLSTEYVTEKTNKKMSSIKESIAVPKFVNPPKIKLKNDIWNYDATAEDIEKDGTCLVKAGTTLTWDDVQKAYKSGEKIVRPGLLHPSMYEIVGETKKLSDKMPSLKKESVYDANEKQKQTQKQTGPIASTPGFNSKTKKTWEVNGSADAGPSVVSESEQLKERVGFDAEEISIKIYLTKGVHISNEQAKQIVLTLRDTYNVRAKIKGNPIQELTVKTFPLSQLINLRQDLKAISTNLEVDPVTLAGVDNNQYVDTMDETPRHDHNIRHGRDRVFEDDDLSETNKIIDEAANELVNFHKDHVDVVDSWKDIQNKTPSSHTVIQEDPAKGPQKGNKKATAVDPFDDIVNITPTSKTIIEEDPEKGPTMGNKKAKEIYPWEDYGIESEWIEETVHNPPMKENNIMSVMEAEKVGKPEGGEKGIDDRVKEQEDKDESLEETQKEYCNYDEWEEKLKELYKGKSVKFEDELYATCAYVGDDEVGEWKEDTASGGSGKIFYSMFDELELIKESINRLQKDHSYDIKYSLGPNQELMVQIIRPTTGLEPGRLAADGHGSTWVWNMKYIGENETQYIFRANGLTTPFTKRNLQEASFPGYTDGQAGMSVTGVVGGYDPSGLDEDDELGYDEDRCGNCSKPIAKATDGNYICKHCGCVEDGLEESESMLHEDMTTADMAVPDMPIGNLQKRKIEEIDRFFSEFVIKNCNIREYIKEGKFNLQEYMNSRPYSFKKQLMEAFDEYMKETHFDGEELPEVGNEDEIHDHLRLEENDIDDEAFLNYKRAFNKVKNGVLQLEKQTNGTDAITVSKVINFVADEFKLSPRAKRQMEIDIFDWRRQRG